jgi:hypothetical protein
VRHLLQRPLHQSRRHVSLHERRQHVSLHESRPLPLPIAAYYSRKGDGKGTDEVGAGLRSKPQARGHFHRVCAPAVMPPPGPLGTHCILFAKISKVSALVHLVFHDFLTYFFRSGSDGTDSPPGRESDGTDSLPYALSSLWLLLSCLCLLSCL